MKKMIKFKSGHVDEQTQVHPTAKIYKAAEVIKSLLDENSIVGDFSRVQYSSLGTYVKIDRNNLIQNSSLGRLTYTGAFTVIQSAQIGSFCSISWGVTIGGGEHDYKKITTHDFFYNDRYDIKEGSEYAYDRYSEICNIGNDVWIGANTTLLRGLVVGNGSVIGANSVVTHNVPDYAVVAGNPARVIKYRFNQNTIKRLLKLKWWDFNFDIIKNNLPVFASNDINFVIDQLESI